MARNPCRCDRRLLILPVLAALLAAVFLILPLIAMFRQMDAESIRAVFAKDTLTAVLLRSVTASSLTTVISLGLAFLLAWAMERTCMPGKKLIRALVELPMLIPSISIGMGVVLLLGNSGILTNLLHLPLGNVYGLPGIVIGGLLYSLPVAFLMIDNILKFEDSAPYEAAKVLGFTPWQQFRAITLPYLKKPLIAAAFSVFTLTFTDYGVPLMVGGKYRTLPVVMYQEVIGQLQFGRGCVYGSMLLIPAVAAFLIDLANQNQANGSFVTRPFAVRPRKSRDLAALLSGGTMAVFCLLPIASFVVLAFVKKYPSDPVLTLDHLVKTITAGGGRYLCNSVLIAALTALIGTALAVLAAYFTARSRAPLSRWLHLLCMSMAAIPGVVLGLSYVLFFRGTALYGTLAILVAVNVVHFFASPYLMMYTSFSKMNENLEAVASTLGISRLRLMWDVLLPRCRQTVAEMLSYYFVNCMMTISAVSFLATVKTKPMALMITQFEAQAQLERAAVVSLAILLINLAVKLTLENLPGKHPEAS